MLRSDEKFSIHDSDEYAKKILGDNIVIVDSKEINVMPKLQKNYGDINDCVIVSVSNITEHFLDYQVDFKIIYDFVEDFAKSHWIYNGDFGTIPLFINKIFKEVNKKWHLKLKNYYKYLNQVGFTFKTIKSIIDTNNPLVLSVYSANDGYYKNHAVVCKGYITYKNQDGKKITLLLINDNWSAIKTYIDYSTISKISSIHYLKK